MWDPGAKCAGPGYARRTPNLAAQRSSDNGGVEANAVSAAAHAPYPRTGPPRHTPCTFGAWAMDLENQNDRQRLDEIQNLLRIRVQLTEYYNFGRIEPGRHGCFFGLENGHLRPQIIIFSRCAALVKAAPYGARGNLH